MLAGLFALWETELAVARKPVPITPGVLAWAMEQAGLSRKDLAERLEVKHDIVDGWLSGESQPGVTEFRRMAELLHRPSATLLLPSPPKVEALSVQFRHPPGAENRLLMPTERLRLREASRLQRGLRWISQELNESVAHLPKLETSDDFDEVAKTLRRQLGVTALEQASWTSESVAFRSWRAAIERLGIVVLALPMGADSARGFSLWDEWVPVIAVNTHWNQAARIFTLFHELGHLTTRTSSVCQESFADHHKAKGDDVERWCESFAAAVLLPPNATDAFLVQRFGWDRKQKISDLSRATAISRRFRVSLRAAVLRLIQRGLAEWSLYRAIPHASENKPGGGGGKGRTRPEARRDEYGARTASLFRTGLARDVLGPDEAIGYLNVGDAELPAFLAPSSAA